MSKVRMDLEMNIATAFRVRDSDDPTTGFPDPYDFPEPADGDGMLPVKSPALPSPVLPDESDGGDGVRLQDEVADTPPVIVSSKCP